MEEDQLGFVLLKIVLIFYKSEYPFWGHWFSKKYIIIIVFVGNFNNVWEPEHPLLGGSVF